MNLLSLSAIRRWLVVSSAAFLLLGCSPSSTTGPASGALGLSADSEVLEWVSDEPLSAALLEYYADRQGAGLDDPAETAELRARLVDSILLARDALKENPQDPQLEVVLDLARIQSLAAWNLSRMRAEVELTDAQLREFYIGVVDAIGHEEIHMINVLYPDEESAAAGLEVAQMAEDFGDWVRSGALAGGQARDMGWVNPAQLPPMLAQAVFALADGEVSQEPLQTEFGWHIFQRRESRPFEPPAFEDVREGILKDAEDRHLEAELERLRAAAGISAATEVD